MRQVCTSASLARKAIESEMRLPRGVVPARPFILSANVLIAGSAAANTLSAAQDIDKCALCLQVGELSGAER